MKNGIFLLIAGLFLLQSCSKEEISPVVEITGPPEIRNLLVNLAPGQDTLTLSREDSFRINFDAWDGKGIEEIEINLGINNDTTLSQRLLYTSSFHDPNVTVSVSHFDHSLERFSYGNGVFYFTQAGDSLTYTLRVEDDDLNVITQTILVVLD